VCGLLPIGSLEYTEMVKEKDDSAKAEKLPKKTDKKPAAAKSEEPKSSKKADPKGVKKAEPKAAAKDSDKANAKAGSKPAALSATSLIFQAPDLPPVEPRKKSNNKKSSDAESESHLRRRSRRRAGEPIDESSDLPNVVVKVRTPRAPKEPSNEPQRVKGSTRLEAKKQRRRDGRDSGRRRQTITETEFLARRESVDRMMLVR